MIRGSGSAAGHDRRAREPGHPLVADAHGGVAEPAILLKPEWRCAIGPGERQAENACGEAPRAERARKR